MRLFFQYGQVPFSIFRGSTFQGNLYESYQQTSSPSSDDMIAQISVRYNHHQSIRSKIPSVHLCGPAPEGCKDSSRIWKLSSCRAFLQMLHFSGDQKKTLFIKCYSTFDKIQFQLSHRNLVKKPQGIQLLYLSDQTSSWAIWKLDRWQIDHFWQASAQQGHAVGINTNIAKN